MSTKTDAKPVLGLGLGRIDITAHIRVLYGAKPDCMNWTGWAVWDDYADECPVYRDKDQAVISAERLAQEYAGGKRT